MREKLKNNKKLTPILRVFLINKSVTKPKESSNRDWTSKVSFNFLEIRA